MLFDVPGRIEQAVLAASDVERGQKSAPATNEYRDDSPFGQQPTQSTSSIEESMYWLHEQGYTYDTLYGLLLGEIDQLVDGARSVESQRDDTNPSETTSRVIGNKGDRASQLNWR